MLSQTAWRIEKSTYSLHCSSFLGLPFRILNSKLVKPKKGTTMETIGRSSDSELMFSQGSVNVKGINVGALIS